MISKFILIGWTVFIGWCFLTGVNDASSVAGSLEYGNDVLPAVIMVAAVFYFFLWALVAFPTYMISRLFARRAERHTLEPADGHYKPRRPVARPYA